MADVLTVADRMPFIYPLMQSRRWYALGVLGAPPPRNRVHAASWTLGRHQARWVDTPQGYVLLSNQDERGAASAAVSGMESESP